jgi:hypothetical protein
MEKPNDESLLGALIFGVSGAAVAGLPGALGGLAVGYFVGRNRAAKAPVEEEVPDVTVRFLSREEMDVEREKVYADEARLQAAADEARADELRLVTNYLHASGVPAFRTAAQELSELMHRQNVGPR